MGNASSKKLRKQPVLTWRTAIWRRLQLWGKLKPVVLNLMNAVGFAKTEEVAAIRTPELGFDDPTAADEDDAVNFTRTLIEDALPVGRTEDVQDQHQPPAAVDGTETVEEIAEERPPSDEPQEEDQEQQEEEVPVRDKDLVQDVQSLIQRMAPDLEKSSKAQPEPAKNVPEEEEAYVSEYIRSSMHVALPTSREGTRSTIGTFPALSYVSREFTDAVGEGAESPETTGHADATDSVDPSPPTPPLPATVKEELDRMLANYETWDSKVYAGLRLDSRSIRLVDILPGSSEEIQVDLSIRQLDDIENAYEALSYVWGPPTPARTIKVRGVIVQVNPNLFDALRALRLPDAKRSIWIDAICINQTKTRERSIEVRKMGNIYRLAKTVVIFLGAPQSPSSSHISDLFKFLNRNDSGPGKGGNGTTINLDALFESCGADMYAVCKGFVELCLRPWWGRIWVMQEFYLASNEPVWHWGDDNVGNAALKRDMDLLMATSWNLYWRADTDAAFRSYVQNEIGKSMAAFSNDVRRIYDLISRRVAINGYDIPSRLYRELSARATDPRDIVYGLREIFDPIFRRVFEPDYFMPPELLFACLVVFLIQFEGWGDVLWWYPFRSEGAESRFPSWLPDFTQRVTPAESDLIPRDHLASRKYMPKMVVLNHILHAEGYKLDEIDRHIHIGKHDGLTVHMWLWRYDRCINNHQPYLNYVMTEDEEQDLWLNTFLQACRENSPGTKRGAVTYPTATILEWTSSSAIDSNFPPNVAESLPCLDILLWHAFRVGGPAIDEVLQDDTNDTPGLLDGVFSPRMDGTFRSTLAVDFLAACVFDWEKLSVVLDHLASVSPWSAANNAHWQTISELSSSDQMENARSRIRSVENFLAEVKQAAKVAWADLRHYTGLCNAILLDCDDHVAFMRVVEALKAARAELTEIAFDYRTRAALDQLAAIDGLVAARLQLYHTITSKYWGRCIFETKLGLHGVTSPGVDFCGKNAILVLDGLSFPVVTRDLDDNSGRGRLAGCAIVRGVEMQDWDGSKTKLPEGISLGKKTIFKFT